METVKSVRQLILVNEWSVTIALTDAYTFRLILTQGSTFFLCSKIRSSNSLLYFQNVLHSIDFRQNDGRYRGSFASTCHLTFSITRRLAHKKSNTQQTYISHNILPTNSSKSRNNSKSKEIRFETSSAIHLHRDGISDTTEYSQGITISYRIPSSDYQIISNSDKFQHELSFLFWAISVQQQTSYSRQISFTTATDVSYLSGDLIFYRRIIKFR